MMRKFFVGNIQVLLFGNFLHYGHNNYSEAAWTESKAIPFSDVTFPYKKVIISFSLVRPPLVSKFYRQNIKTRTMYLVKVEPADVIKGLLVVLDVLELDLEVPVVLVVLLGQVEGVLVVPRRTTHFDGRLHVKVHLTILRLVEERKITKA